MKSKSPAHSQPPAHSFSFETPKKKISTSADSSKQDSEDGFQTPKIKRRSSTKKSQRKRRPSESDEEKIDRKTEENIQQVAIKNNLTEDAVKKILKKVVSNDHVIAIVKLKEEEMEKNSQIENKPHNGDADDEEDRDEDVEHAPKITRSKAKVLNKKILPITSPSEPSEASILIAEELRSDDEDEEYEPGNESDDEHNSSVSDMDSQPRTPKTPYTAEEDSPTKYTNDGLFKIPRDRNDSSTSLNEQDYIIAKRTRSKVSLATTSIETIESTFQPPDISPDMYDRDNELDTDWLEFLNVLTKPINQTIEDDDETDPEYIAAADQIPIDKEELREVNISKKELNDLVDELFSNLSDVDFDEMNKYDIIPELFRTKQKSNRNDSNHDPNRSDSSNELNRSDTQANTSFQPSQVSTPVSSKEKSIQRNPSTSAVVVADESTVSILSNLTTNQSASVLDANSQTQTLVAVNVVNPFQGATLVNGVIQLPQYQQIMIQLPTIDVLKLQAQQLQQQQQQQQPGQQEQIMTPNAERPDSRFAGECKYIRVSGYQYKLYEHLDTDLPVDVTFDEGFQGFTQNQRDILDQQLRMHVQFATQNFLQVYGNPGNNLWKQAPKLKTFLTELNDLTDGSSVTIENLRPALDTINKWEEDLMRPDTDENKAYAEFFLGELEKSQKAVQARGSYVPKFSKRMMDAVAASSAFMYPHLLPKIPFRMDNRHKNFLSEFIAVEDYLIAFHLEKLYGEYRDERIRNNRRESKNNVPLERICDKICSRMCPFRLSDSKNAVYRYVCRRKSKFEIYNPIQYYFKHNRAPPFKHELIDVHRSKECAPVDYPFHKYPSVWAAHIKQRLAIEHSIKLRQIQNNSKPKPVQRVSPQVRCGRADNRNSSETPISKPIFVVRPITTEADGSLPLHYEIVQVNSNADTDAHEVHQSEHVVAAGNSTPSGVECVSEVTNEQVNESTSESPTEVQTIKQRNNTEGRKPSSAEKLIQILKFLHKNYFEIQARNPSKENHLLMTVQSSVLDFSVFMSFVEVNLKMANVIKRTVKDKVDESNNRKSKATDDVIESSDGNIIATASNAIVNVPTKKTPKAQRTDNTRLMLLPETKEDINEKDLVYAQNFMDKVEEIYAAENKFEKVTEFLHILQTFNQSTDKVEDLYYKMEQLFLPDHPELAELFLTFLLPGHAAQIGKFMEHFMLTNMNHFINKLNIYFNKQPAQIRKIMTCLRDLSNEDDLKLDQIKAKIFPLLKGNPLLIEWFKQCFPSDTNTDCTADEFESLSFYKAAENAHQTDDENDVYENVNQSEIVPDPVDNPCHIRYLNGRMYYGSRILLPAKLSFLIVTASDQNAINEVARSEPTQAKQKDSAEGSESSDYRCVHSIKQYGDNKMKECQKNQLETPDNSVCEDAEIEKSTEEQNCSDATDDAEVQASEVQNDEKNLSNSTESLENVYNTCDDLTLKAHGIRLNPTVHQSNVIKSEDLLCLLDPVDDVADKISEESLKNSPRKQTTRAQRKSPNAKKSTKRSPINSRKSQPVTTIIPDDSNAIRTAKRLKRLIESDDPEEPDRVVKKSKPTKCTKVSADVNKNRKNKLSSSDEVMASSSSDVSVKTEASTSATETASTSASATTTEWSRDEDKLVLEQIKMGFTNEENLVETLHRETLPNRSYTEIFDRFKFLMDIIANL